MAQTFTHLLTHVIFPTKERRTSLKAEMRPRLFSYAPAGFVRLSLSLPRVWFTLSSLPRGERVCSIRN